MLEATVWHTEQLAVFHRRDPHISIEYDSDEEIFEIEVENEDTDKEKYHNSHFVEGYLIVVLLRHINPEKEKKVNEISISSNSRKKRRPYEGAPGIGPKTK
mgnify:CR=1 FL=1|jgi:hypothetical protein